MSSQKLLFTAVSVVALTAGLCRAAVVSSPEEPMSVWFTAPAGTFHESCVLGNGRLGAMDLGGVDNERIALNESSLWSGGPYDGNRYGAYKCLPEVRQKLFAGDISGAGAGWAAASVMPTAWPAGWTSTSSAPTRRSAT